MLDYVFTDDRRALWDNNGGTDFHTLLKEYASGAWGERLGQLGPQRGSQGAGWGGGGVQRLGAREPAALRPAGPHPTPPPPRPSQILYIIMIQ